MLSPNGVRAILFDLDGTLRHSRPSFNQAFFDIAVQLGAPKSTGGRRRATRWLLQYWADSADMLADRETFGERQDLFWINHARLNLVAYGLSEGQAKRLAPEVYRQMEAAYQPEDWVPPDVPETLKFLHHSGFILGVASNRTNPYEDLLQSTGLYKFFEIALAAGEVNAWKPKKSFFYHALQRLGTQAQETLYVGDNYFADVLGAQGAGLQAVLLDTEQLFPEADCAVIETIGELTTLLKK